MRKNLYDQERRFKIKFILSSIKEIITDGRERYYFLKEGDRVFRDIFFEKKFISKLMRCTRTYESNIVLDEIGIETLHELFNTSSYMEILRTMIDLVCKINQLEYKIKKLEKKKRNIPKSLSKEYHWVKDLYKKCVKRLRKDLRLKDSIPYKEKYKNILKYVKNKKSKNIGLDIFDDDFDPIYDEIYEYDDDFDDEDEYYSDNRYADFIRKENEKIERNKRKPQRNQRKRRIRKETDIDYDDDFDDDDFEDYGEEDTDISESEKIADLESQVRSINRYLSSQNASINNNINKPSRPNLGPDFEYYEDVVEENKPKESSNHDIMRKLDTVVKTVVRVAEKQDDLSSRLSYIESDLYEETKDEDDDDSPPPQFTPGGSDPIANVQ